MVNVWCFSGNVGQDATLRSTQSGEKVLSFTVANKVGFGDRATTQWIECSFWGKRGEAVANFIKKGDKVSVSGELKLEEYTKRDGTPATKLSVRVNDMDLGSGNREGGNRDAGARQDGGYDQSPYGQSSRGPAPRQHGGGGGSTGGRPQAGKPDPFGDEIPFVSVEGFDLQGCAGPVPPRARRFTAEA